MGEIIYARFRDDDGKPNELVLSEKEMQNVVTRIKDISQVIKEADIRTEMYEKMVEKTEHLSLAQIHSILLESDKVQWIMQPTYFKALLDRFKKDMKISD